MPAPPCHMVTIIGKLLSWTEVRGLPHNPVTLHHDHIICRILMDKPLTPLNADPLIRMIPDLDEVDEWMRPVFRMIQARHVDDVIDIYANAVQFFKEGFHRRAL